MADHIGQVDQTDRAAASARSARWMSGSTCAVRGSSYDEGRVARHSMCLAARIGCRGILRCAAGFRRSDLVFGRRWHTFWSSAVSCRSGQVSVHVRSIDIMVSHEVTRVSRLHTY